MLRNYYGPILFIYALLSADKAYAYWSAFEAANTETTTLVYFIIMPVIVSIELHRHFTKCTRAK